MLKKILKYLFLFLLLSGQKALAQSDSAMDKRTKARIVADSLADKQKNEINEEIKRFRKEVSASKPAKDSIPQLKKPKLKRPEIDSVGVSFENGKFNLPDQVPKNVDEESLKKLAKEQLPGVSKPDVTKPGVGIPGVAGGTTEKDLKSIVEKKLEGKIPGTKAKENESKIKTISDSVTRLTKAGEDLLSGKPLLAMKKVYSEKALKKLYDSLGISRIDSVLALAASKKEVSKDDLLAAINAPMLTAPAGSEATGFKDAMKGQDLSSMKEDLPMPDLGKMKLPQDALSELPPVHGFQFPSDKFKLLDSMRKVNLAKSKLTLKEENVKQGVERVLAKRKPRFWDKAYFEGIVGYLKHKESNLLQFSPSLGYHLNKNFSVGLGPSILLQEKDKKWNVSVGYRTFVKAEIFRQHAYLQVEDNVDPAGLSKEFVHNMNHSILTGGGVLIPITGKFSLNFAVLYRVNNEQYSGNAISPWVFRLGLSSVKSVKK